MIKHIVLLMAALCSTAFLTACGDETASPSTTSKTTKTTKASTKGHFFKKPYKCKRQVESTSKRTGNKVILNYITYFSPQRGWRIELTGSEGSALKVANLYTPEARYDGAYKAQDGVITGINFGTAWLHKELRPKISLGSLSKYKKKNCEIMTDISVFEIDYLDTLEVMGQ